MVVFNPGNILADFYYKMVNVENVSTPLYKKSYLKTAPPTTFFQALNSLRMALQSNPASMAVRKKEVPNK